MSALEERIKQIADLIRKQVAETLLDVESDILPYVEDDTASNAEIQAGEIVRNIIAGKFVFDGDYIVIDNVRDMSPRVRLVFTSLDYDSIRDKIIERMQKCPKDAKIAALESQLKRSYDLKEPALLLTALRQYSHNHGEGFVFGYDKAETDRIVTGLVEALEEIIKAAPSSGPLWHWSEQIVEARAALDAHLKHVGDL